MCRAGGVHQPLRATAGPTADGHEQHVVLPCRHQVAPHVASPAGDDGDVADSPWHQAPDGLLPRRRQHVARCRRDHPGELVIGEPPPDPIAPDPGHLDLAEQVLGAGRAPVGAKGDGQPLIEGGWDVGRDAVQPEVRERRPHDRAGRAATLHRDGAPPAGEVRAIERAAVDRRQPGPQAAGAGEVFELLGHPGRRPSLGAVVDEGPPAVERPGHLGQIAHVEGQRRCPHRIVERADLLVLDPSHQRVRRVTAEPGPALHRRRPAGQCPHLAVRQQALWGPVGEHPRRPGHGRLVRRSARPDVVVQERLLLARLHPERQGVVAEVGVQVDEPGVDDGVADVDHRRRGEPRRRPLTGAGHGLDVAVVTQPDASLERPLLVATLHRSDRAGQDERHQVRRVVAVSGRAGRIDAAQADTSGHRRVWRHPRVCGPDGVHETLRCRETLGWMRVSR